MFTEFLISANLVLLAVCYYIYQNKKVEYKTKTIILSGRDSDKREIGDIDGIFEIHITVDHTQGFLALVDFKKRWESGEKGNLKILFAVSNENNNQYMISHFTRKDNIKKAVEKANQIADEMKSAGIMIKRVKVEAMVSNTTKGIPLNTEEYKALYGVLTSQGFLGKPYFEFHVKIQNYYALNLDGVKTEVQNELDICNTQGDIQIAVSWNLMSKNMLPLLTLRMYDLGLVEAQMNKDIILNTFKSLGYILVDQIQEEFSVYDSFIDEDKGWIVQL